MTYPVLVEPKPISDALEAHLKDTLSQIPSGKRGQITGAVTTDGIEASIGTKIHGGTVSAFAAHDWDTRGWLAGTRAVWSW